MQVRILPREQNTTKMKHTTSVSMRVNPLDIGNLIKGLKYLGFANMDDEVNNFIIVNLKGGYEECIYFDDRHALNADVCLDAYDAELFIALVSRTNDNYRLPTEYVIRDGKITKEPTFGHPIDRKPTEDEIIEYFNKKNSIVISGSLPLMEAVLKEAGIVFEAKTKMYYDVINKRFTKDGDFETFNLPEEYSKVLKIITEGRYPTIQGIKPTIEGRNLVYVDLGLELDLRWFDYIKEIEVL